MWELCDSRELEDELDTACASGDHSDEMESRELDMMRLPFCVIAMTSLIWHRGCVLGFVRQTVRNMRFASDHFFYVVQILDAAGIWS